MSRIAKPLKGLIFFIADRSLFLMANKAMETTGNKRATGPFVNMPRKTAT